MNRACGCMRSLMGSVVNLNLSAFRLPLDDKLSVLSCGFPNSFRSLKKLQTREHVVSRDRGQFLMRRCSLASDNLNIILLKVYLGNTGNILLWPSVISELKRHVHRHLLPSVHMSPSAAGQKKSLRTHRAQDAAAPALLNARARTRRPAGQSAGRVEGLAFEKKVKWRSAPFGWTQCLRWARLVWRWSRSAARSPSGLRLNTSSARFFESDPFAVTLEGTKEHFNMCGWGCDSSGDVFHSRF